MFNALKNLTPATKEVHSFKIVVTRFSIIDFSTMKRGCKICKKEDAILAGLPDRWSVRVPITKSDLDTAAERIFYIGADFDYDCNNGYSHVVKGLTKDKRFYISSRSTLEESEIREIGSGFEQTLANFLPRFAAYLRESNRKLPERLGQEF